MLNPIELKYIKDRRPHEVRKKTRSTQKAVNPKFCKCCGSQSLDALLIQDKNVFWECQECEFVFTVMENEDVVVRYMLDPLILETTNPEIITKSLDFLKPALSWLPRKELKILDFGCGESNIPELLRDKGHRVVAVDIIPPTKHHRDRLTGDIMDLDLTPDSFDLIYAHDVFEHLSEPRFILKRLFHLLKRDGMILIHNNMEREVKTLEELLKSDKNYRFSFYRQTTFEKMIENMGRKIIYKNSSSIVTR